MEYDNDHLSNMDVLEGVRGADRSNVNERNDGNDNNGVYD
jgi:hypothetical protein